MCCTVYSFLLGENIATNLKLNNAILIIYGLYALVVIKNMCLVTKAATIVHASFQARAMGVILV